MYYLQFKICMKINKLIKAFSLLLVVAFAACSDFEDTITDSPLRPAGNQGVYFPTTNSTVFELEPTDPTQLTLTIEREVSSGAFQVPINVEINDSSVFNVPQSVSFADGETEVEFTITFPEAEEGVTYNLALSVSGDDIVNPYGVGVPNISTNVTRIKWEAVEAPMVYVDGTFQGAGWSDATRPMYVTAEKAELGSTVRYRFKNVYKPSTGADDDGIYDGYHDVGFDPSRDWYTTIEIEDPDGEEGDVLMFRHEIGVTRGSYGMSSIGSNGANRGTLADSIITFAAGALAFWDNDGGYAANPTYIYLSKEVYIAANMIITDFNDVEYVEIEGELGEYESLAYNEVSSKTISQAIDIDSLNDKSVFADLYYISDVYAEDFGLAFYNLDGIIRIPENQPTGTKVFGQDVFVSQSSNHASSIEVNYKGTTVYTFGLIFHYEDGTIVGDFIETYFYKEDALVYTKADFLGEFILIGGSAPADVEIAEESDNNFVITGISRADAVNAVFNSTALTFSISPQPLADVTLGEGEEAVTYNATWYTQIPAGLSASAALEFEFDRRGNLIVAESSVGYGFRILGVNVADEDDAGYLNSNLNPSFIPVVSEVEALETQSVINLRSSNNSDTNFFIQGKKSSSNASVSVKQFPTIRVN